MTQKTNQNPWTMDVRVRERNLKSGALTDKDLEKHLAALPDLADQAEPFGTSQPALEQQHAPVAAVVAPPSDPSLDDDEPEEDEDEDEPAAEAPAAPVVEEGGGETTNNGEGSL